MSDSSELAYTKKSMQWQNEHKAKIALVQEFCDEVCAIAERRMQETNRLEGQHYAAMQIVLKRWRERWVE